MTELFFLCSCTAAGSVRGAAGVFFIAGLLSSGRPWKKGFYFLLAGTAALSVASALAGLPDFYRILSETVFLTICAVRFLGTDTRMSLFLGCFYEIAAALWQFLIAAWLGVTFRAPAFLDCRTGEGQAALWLLHFLLAVLAWYFLKHSFRPVSMIGIAGFLAVVTLSQQTTLVIADDTLDMWTILSVILMMAVLVFHMNRQYEYERELARLKSQQSELLERDYLALNRSYAVNAKLFHDFHNHIGVLRRMLSHQKTEEAVRYLDELQAPVQEMTDTVWTGDETLDYLINSKAAAAREKGILYEAEVEFPRHTNLQSADLCAILGNLLDNALEAACQVQESQRRFVRLTIRRINQMVIVKVENSFASVPTEKDGVLETSKNREGLHGWGLKSARAAAGKYDGIVRTSYTETAFTAVATLSYQGVSAQ